MGGTPYFSMQLFAKDRPGLHSSLQHGSVCMISLAKHLVLVCVAVHASCTCM